MGRGFESRRRPLCLQHNPNPRSASKRRGNHSLHPTRLSESLKEGQGEPASRVFTNPHLTLQDWVTRTKASPSPLPPRRVPASGKRGRACSESCGRKHPLRPTAGKRLLQNSSGGCQDKSFIPMSFSQECGITTPKQREAVGQQQAFSRTVTVPRLALSVLVLPRVSGSYELRVLGF